MRYHWGLGVGDFHAHQAVLRASENSPHGAESQGHDVEDDDHQSEPAVNPETANHDGASMRYHSEHNNGADGSDASESDDGELGLDDRHQEGWEDEESEVEDGEAENFDGPGEAEEEDHTGM